LASPFSAASVRDDRTSFTQFDPQHDPQPDPEFARHCHSRLPQAFLDQITAVEGSLQTPDAGVPRVRRLTPEKPQQRIAWFTQPTEPLRPH